MIGYEVSGRTALITLDRVEARNAINRAMATGIEDAVDRAENDPDVWVVVLRAATSGDKPVFCSGQDLKAIGSPEGNSVTERGGFAGLVQRDRTKPLIAAVDGLATAGGCEIVLACDLVVATTRSSFGLAEVKRNLIAGAGGLFRLPRAIGRAAAMDAILTGDSIPAERAYQLGLVSRLVDGPVDDAAMTLAGRIAENAPLAVRASRAVVLAEASSDDATLWSMTNSAMRQMFESDDLREGLTAFAEKRAPNWQGR